VIRLHHDEQNGEQDGCCVDDARRRIVSTAAQQVSGKPERCRWYAVTVEQPIEDRCGANLTADDVRVPSDAPENAECHRSGKPAERGQRPLLGHPGDAGDHQRERYS
jgi:hypothetical protein